MALSFVLSSPFSSPFHRSSHRLTGRSKPRISHSVVFVSTLRYSTLFPRLCGIPCKIPVALRAQTGETRARCIGPRNLRVATLASRERSGSQASSSCAKAVSQAHPPSRPVISARIFGYYFLSFFSSFNIFEKIISIKKKTRILHRNFPKNHRQPKKRESKT